MGKRKIFNNEGDDDVNAEKVEMDEESSSSHIDAGCWSKQKLKHKRGNRVICPGIDTLSYKHAKRFAISVLSYPVFYLSKKKL